MEHDQPFAGIRVVEFGQFIAVPYCAQLLAEGGAYVVKIESLEGDPTRMMAPIEPGESRHFLSRNRGKHILPLDLRSPGSQRVIDALLASADVVVTNFRPGLAEDFGLDYATLSARYPRLIVGNVTAFGRKGPDALLAGFDPVVQARSGLASALGHEVNGLPTASDPSLVDYMCAMTLAFGLSSALLRRERTGRGGEVTASLLMAALTLQNTAMTRVDVADRAEQEQVLAELADARERGVSFAEQAGMMPLNKMNWMNTIYLRTYMTKDRPIAVACAGPKLHAAFLRATGLSDAWLGRAAAEDRSAFGAHYAQLKGEFEAVLAARPAAEWKVVFEREGVPHAEMKFPLEMLFDEQTDANGMVRDVEHPTLGTARVLGSPVTMDGDGFVAVSPSAAFGSEVGGILRDAGFTADEIEGLLASGVSRDHWRGK